MSTLQRLWCATRDDVVRIGEASRPPLLDAAPKLNAEEAKRAQVEQLDRNGPKQMSDDGYARVQILLEAAQARPAGLAEKLTKNCIRLLKQKSPKVRVLAESRRVARKARCERQLPAKAHFFVAQQLELDASSKEVAGRWNTIKLWNLWREWRMLLGFERTLLWKIASKPIFDV